MLKEKNYILYLLIEITESKIVIWDAGMTVLAVPALQHLHFSFLLVLLYTLSFCCGQ
jgi:hypothetical protein